jgi:hypothetical protein
MCSVQHFISEFLLTEAFSMRIVDADNVFYPMVFSLNLFTNSNTCLLFQWFQVIYNNCWSLIIGWLTQLLCSVHNKSIFDQWKRKPWIIPNALYHYIFMWSSFLSPQLFMLKIWYAYVKSLWFFLLITLQIVKLKSCW